MADHHADAAVLTDHEIFRRARRLRRPRRYRSAVTTAASRPLTPGGYVVHLEHGIGIYAACNDRGRGGWSDLEVAVVEYEGGDRLNVRSIVSISRTVSHGRRW